MLLLKPKHSSFPIKMQGLDAGVILWKTFIFLGLPLELVDVHLIGKNSTVHDEVERTAMQTKDPKYIIVVDQGSRAAPPIVDSAYVKSLLIDHHQSDVFPKNALVGYIPPTAPHARQQSQINATPGCVCMSLPTNSDLSPIDIRAM